jgi:F420-0:gamma-glutamyl ligase-like protein
VVELEKTFSNVDLPASKKALATIPATYHLQVLAVLMWQLSKQSIHNKIGYLCRLVSNVKNGTFTPIAVAATPISLDERIKQEKIKREKEAQRGKKDNVTHFADMVKRYGDKFIVPEEYRQAVFERLGYC